MSKLFILTEDGQVQAVELNPGRNRLGHDLENDCRIDDPTISSFHCEIFVENAGTRVKDLGSTNGTYIDGNRIHESRLQPGQTLQVGGVEMRFDVPPVQIAIPEMPAPEAPAPTFLEDGTPCCLSHPQVAASHVCLNCHQPLCENCGRDLHRVGGKHMVFCSACGGQCEVIGAAENDGRGRKPWIAAIASGFRKTLTIFAAPPRRKRERRRR